jgi:hypothetical protein
MSSSTRFRPFNQYTTVDIRVVEAVIVRELDELLEFADRIREHVQGSAL